MRGTGSTVWKHFIKCSSGGQCKLCLARLVVKSSGNTTNLKNHLIRKHKHVLKEDSLDSDSESQSAESKKQKVADSHIEIDRDRNNSEADTLTVTTASSSTCSSTSSFRTQPLINASFSEIKSFQDGGPKNAKITNAILFMVCKDNMPLNVTEKQGFQHLLQSTVPLYKIPSRKTVTKLIDEKFDYLSKQVKEMLKQVQNYSITTDVWTETMNTKSFLGVTCHFFFENKSHTVTIGVKELNGSHTADYLQNCLEEIFDEWHIDKEKLIAIVTDNGANIVSAVAKTVGKNKHIPCFAHTLNLAAVKVIEEPRCKNIIEKVSKIVTFFKQSVSAADALRNCQEEEHLLQLIQSVSTRWNSTFYMLERFVKLVDYVAQTLLKFPKSPPMLDAFELVVIGEILQILKPFEEATNEVCGEKYLTASYCIPVVNCLIKKVNSVVPTSEIVEKIKEVAVNELKKRFGSIELVKILAVATVLDPRFKKLHFTNVTACANAINVINDAISDLQTDNSNNSSQSTETEDNIHEKPEGFWSHHTELVNKQFLQQKNVNDEGLQLQLKLFLTQPTIPLKSDPVLFWKNFPDPALKKIAERFMSVVGTSVPSERLFSKAGNIITQARNRLTGKRLSKLLFLNSLELQQWNA